MTARPQSRWSVKKVARYIARVVFSCMFSNALAILYGVPWAAPQEVDRTFHLNVQNDSNANRVSRLSERLKADHSPDAAAVYEPDMWFPGHRFQSGNVSLTLSFRKYLWIIMRKYKISQPWVKKNVKVIRWSPSNCLSRTWSRFCQSPDTHAHARARRHRGAQSAMSALTSDLWCLQAWCWPGARLC